jgi:hypothetical protein
MFTGSSVARPLQKKAIIDDMDAALNGAPADAEEVRLAERPLGERLLWFAGLWLGGLLVTAAIAYGLRALLFSGS